jgi:hypothetical protein
MATLWQKIWFTPFISTTQIEHYDHFAAFDALKE